MEPSIRNQAIWLALGAALGTFVERLLHALRAAVGGLRDVGRICSRAPCTGIRSPARQPKVSSTQGP